ncbi:hypothetical protein BKA61DRAFT_278006 [Leptodontidium sp. MPI-SDFR-AT-0119]|nr:hypothetical protein BKA61DRAFT_278006 [Leptodontidium sp. MPI-SDFR-AT-0119]
MVTKIRTQTTTDDELLEECKTETECGDCDISWTTPPKRTEITAPEETVAVVVDVVNYQGAIRIYQKGSNKSVDAVGMEEAGKLVIVPWDSDWWFRASGSLRVGYIKKKGR